MVFNPQNPVQLIFIINNYEAFFRDPLSNGIFKYVEREILTRNWIDREDLVFTWQRTTYSDASVDEAPVIGSHKEAFGAMIDLIQILREATP